MFSTESANFRHLFVIVKEPLVPWWCDPNYCWVFVALSPKWENIIVTHYYFVHLLH